MTAEAQPVGRHMRDAILEAAAALFAERGYNATSVREVVEAAGCRKPTLYYYFGSKEQLFLELITESCDRIRAVVDGALSAPGTVRQRLQVGLHAYLDHVTANPTVLRLLMTAERHPEQGQPSYNFDGLRQENIRGTRAIFEQGVAAGELRPDLDLEEAVLALFAIVDHRLVLFLHGRPIPDDFPERLLDLFFNGVGA